MAGDILVNYGTAVAMTVTNLHSLASSQTWIGGWTSDGVDNGTNEYEDCLISGQFTSHATTRQIGQLYVYAYGNYGDTAFSATNPDLFATGTEGTEGVATFTATAQRDAGLRLLYAMTATATASEIYVMPPTSLAQAFGGWVPDWWALWITNNLVTTTAAGLAAAGSKISYLPVHHRYT